MSDKKLSGRAFTSLCSMFGFILLILTGIILYIEPHGRVAYWSKWSFWGLEKGQWDNIHIFSGLLFLAAGGFHLYYNWKPLIKYLSARVETTLRYKRELGVCILILLYIVASGIWSLPPLAYVSDLGENIKSSWVTSPELEPPFGHAELVSLKTFCKKQRIPLDQAMAELRNAGFKVNSPNETLEEIATSKGTSGMGVYNVIRKLESTPEAIGPGVAWTPEKIEETFSGTGLGRRSFAQIIKDLSINGETARKRLKKFDIAVKDNDQIKELADKHDSTPIKLLTIILIEDN